jgi:hypothetical protein
MQEKRKKSEENEIGKDEMSALRSYNLGYFLKYLRSY